MNRIALVIVSLLAVAGIGYAGYYYGAANRPAPQAVNNSTTSMNGTPVDLRNTQGNGNIWNTPSNVVTNTTTPTRVDNNVVITSPKNGAVVTHYPFTISGTVSPNAKQIAVTANATGYWDGLDNQKSEKRLDVYKLTQFKPGDTTWSYNVAPEYGNLDLNAESGRYIVEATFQNGQTMESQIQVSFAFAGAEMGKPVIYLYPPQPMQVNVNVQPTSGISVTEPAIGTNGWSVWAEPTGRLTTADGKSWPYLFWEGFASNFLTPKEGFVVAASDVSSFFDAKLSYLGLNAKEISDFKEFWVPRFTGKPYYFITFIDQATFSKYAPLTVNPRPDTVIRVFFDYRGLDGKVTVPAQQLQAGPARNGFTVVEWGGRLYR